MNPTKRTNLARTLTFLALLTHPQLQTLEEITFYEPFTDTTISLSINKSSSFNHVLDDVVLELKKKDFVSEQLTKEDLQLACLSPTYRWQMRRGFETDKDLMKEFRVNELNGTFGVFENQIVEDQDEISKDLVQYFIYVAKIQIKLEMDGGEFLIHSYSRKQKCNLRSTIQSIKLHLEHHCKKNDHEISKLQIYIPDRSNKQYNKLQKGTHLDYTMQDLLTREKLFKLGDTWLITLDDKGDTYKPKPSHAGYDLLHNPTTNQENNNKPQEHENSEVKEPENEEERKENNKENKPNYPLINPNDNNVENNNMQSDETEYFLTYCRDNKSNACFHIVEKTQEITEDLNSIKNTLKVEKAHYLHIFAEKGWVEICDSTLSELDLSHLESPNYKPKLLNLTLLKETFPIDGPSENTIIQKVIHKGAQPYDFDSHQPQERYNKVYDGIIDQLKHILKNKEAKPTPPSQGITSKGNTNDRPINNNKPLNDSNDDANNDDDKNSSNMGYYMLGAVGIISLGLITLPFIIKKHKKKSSNTTIEKV